jgi:hypothetical protein
LVEDEAWWWGFSEETGLVRGGEGDCFVEHATADFGDVPAFQGGIDLMANRLGDINRSEASEAGGAEPAGGGLGAEGLTGVGLGELLPEFFDEVGREDLLGAGVKENAREESSEGFPESGIRGL